MKLSQKKYWSCINIFSKISSSTAPKFWPATMFPTTDCAWEFGQPRYKLDRLRAKSNTTRGKVFIFWSRQRGGRAVWFSPEFCEKSPFFQPPQKCLASYYSQLAIWESFCVIRALCKQSARLIVGYRSKIPRNFPRIPGDSLDILHWWRTHVHCSHQDSPLLNNNILRVCGCKTNTCHKVLQKSHVFFELS